jgi:M6 family metalloprotease-like protein
MSWTEQTMKESERGGIWRNSGERAQEALGKNLSERCSILLKYGGTPETFLSFRAMWPTSLLVLVLVVSNLPPGSVASYVGGTRPAVIGEQKTVVLLMKFQDMRSEPDPPSHYSDRIFSEMNAYYLEASFGQVSVSGKVYGWYTLPQPWSYYINSQYPLGNRRVMMEDSVKTADSRVDFRNFRYAMIVFNNHLVAPPDCCVAFAEGDQDFQTGDGLVRLGVLLYPVTKGDPAHAPLGVFAHEFAHNFGLSHSLSGNWDVMSGCNGPLCDKPPHPISYNKIKLGWITSAQVRTINPGESTTVELHELETKSSSCRAVKIPLSNGMYYLIESRKRVGFDAYLPGEGVLISHVDENRNEPSHLVDANPGTSTLDDAAWQVGQTFTDTTNSVSVTILESSAHSYTISVRVGGGRQGELSVFDLNYDDGALPHSDGSDEHATTVKPSVPLTVFFIYTEGNTGGDYIVRVYTEWDKGTAIAKSDEHGAISEVSQENGGSRWGIGWSQAPSTPGTYKIRFVYSASRTPPTWDHYDRLLAEGTVTVSASAVTPLEPVTFAIMILIVVVVAGALLAFHRLKSRPKEAQAKKIQARPKTKSCISCRMELPLDAKFCDNCGASQKA